MQPINIYVPIHSLHGDTAYAVLSKQRGMSFPSALFDSEVNVDSDPDILARYGLVRAVRYMDSFVHDSIEHKVSIVFMEDRVDGVEWVDEADMVERIDDSVSLMALSVLHQNREILQTVLYP